MKAKVDSTEVNIERTHRISSTPQEPQIKKRSRAQRFVDEEVEVNRIRESSATRKVSDTRKDDEEEVGPVVRFRYVTSSYHEEPEHFEKGSEHRDEGEASRRGSHDTKDKAIREQELGSFRYVPAPQKPECPGPDDELTTLIESAHGSHHETSWKGGTVHSVESDCKPNDVYREDGDGADRYLGSFRHVAATGSILPPLPDPTDSEQSPPHVEGSNKERLRRLSAKDEDEDAFRTFRYVLRGSPSQRPSKSKLDSPSSQRHIRRASVSNLTVDVPSRSHCRTDPIPNTIKYASALHNREVERLKAEQHSHARPFSYDKEDDLPISHHNGEVRPLRSTSRVSSLKQRFEKSNVEPSYHSRPPIQRSEDYIDKPTPHPTSQREHVERATGTFKHVGPSERDDGPTTANSSYSQDLIHYGSGALDTPYEEAFGRGREARRDESPPPRRPSRVRFVSPAICSLSSTAPATRTERQTPPSDRIAGDSLAQYREENAQMRLWEESWSEDRRRELLRLERERSRPRRERRYRVRDVQNRADRGQDERRSSHRGHPPSQSSDHIKQSDSSREDYINYSSWHNQPKTPPAGSPSTSTIERLASPPPEGYEGLMHPSVNPDPGATTPFSERSLAYGEKERHFWRMMFKTDVEQSPLMRTSEGIRTYAGLSANGCDGAGAIGGRWSCGMQNSRKPRAQGSQSQKESPSPLMRMKARGTDTATASPLSRFVARENKEFVQSPNTVRKKKVRAQKDERKKTGSGYVSPYVSEVSGEGEEIEED